MGVMSGLPSYDTNTTPFSRQCTLWGWPFGMTLAIHARRFPHVSFPIIAGVHHRTRRHIYIRIGRQGAASTDLPRAFTCLLVSYLALVPNDSYYLVATKFPTLVF